MKFLEFFDNRGYGIKVKYPNEWEKKENIKEAVVVFLSPLEDDSDNFRENVSIMVRPTDINADLLNDYIEFEIEQLKATFLNFQLIKKAKTTLSRQLGYNIIFTGKRKGIKVKIMQSYTVINRVIYLITYTAEFYKFNHFIKVVKKLVKSFKVVNV